jgi:hypothetical protein
VENVAVGKNLVQVNSFPQISQMNADYLLSFSAGISEIFRRIISFCKKKQSNFP